MRTLLGSILAFSLLLGTSPFADAQDKGEQGQAQASAAVKPLCPISGKELSSREYSTEYKGKKVYFCCNKCPKMFLSDPSKYAEQVKAQWEAMRPLRVQVKCPGTGKPINPKIFVEGEHAKVYFCCNNCKSGWNKDSSKMKAKLKDSYTYQTSCPIMGGDIDPTVSATYKDRTIYYCCSMCDKKFQKDPAKYLAKIDEEIKANKAALAKRHGG